MHFRSRRLLQRGGPGVWAWAAGGVGLVGSSLGRSYIPSLPATAMDEIDLCTPEASRDASPRREREGPSPEPSPAAGRAPTPPPHAASPAALLRRQGKRKVSDVGSDSAGLASKRPDAGAMDVDDPTDAMEDVCQEVEDPGKDKKPEDDGADLEDEDGDDVQFAGRTGALPLSDFPHARFNCMSKKFLPGKEAAFCQNCFCYVCDIAASKCAEWTSHCKASHSSLTWQAERHRKRIIQTLSVPATSSAAASSSSDAAPTYITRWSCDQLLEAIQQVYPVEADNPSGLAAGISLRPYQKQSLAFMVHVETHGYPGHDNSTATTHDYVGAGTAHLAGGAASTTSAAGAKPDVKPNVVTKPSRSQRAQTAKTAGTTSPVRTTRTLTTVDCSFSNGRKAGWRRRPLKHTSSRISASPRSLSL